ncbi:CTB family bacteriocin [Gloeocapsopsis crepidinum LEGE 06123]|uniref:CTB family bacteriocin n=1 Tax=Gloeocapsopsis crepidinum LEGE 06123 TaxID=588587 RepID=A0ABR9UVT1_9CHRO|nr:CTB family bacteriocin [Gloeocapsopsis crepidinum]MBE9192392.1 CTB family bacteriocin [Gloeocapsopsis crepidinum LEGE 06123]
MSELNIHSKLLTNLSEEQQEALSGGISLQDLVSSAFSQEALVLGSTAKTGRNGSDVTQVLAAEDIVTEALKDVNLNI